MNAGSSKIFMATVQEPKNERQDETQFDQIWY